MSPEQAGTDVFLDTSHGHNKRVMSPEQLYIQDTSHWNNKRVMSLEQMYHPRYITLEQLLDLGVVSLVPPGTRHRALTVPAHAAAPPPPPPSESRRRCRLDVGTRLADRERSWLFPRFRHRRRSAGTTAPEESDEGQWPGFGLRWSVDVHRLLVAAQQ